MQRLEINVTTGEHTAIDLSPEEIAALQAAEAARQATIPYIEKRAAAYPSIQEQLDLLYWDTVNSTNTWQQAIAAVKSHYPKV